MLRKTPILSIKNIKRQNIVPGIDMVRGLTASQAWKIFGMKLLDIQELHGFAAKHPVAYLEVIKETPYLTSRTLLLTSDVPLYAYIKNRLFSYTDRGVFGEFHKLVVPESSLAKAGINLQQEYPLLQINGGYSIRYANTAEVRADGLGMGCKMKKFVVKFLPQCLDSLGQFVKLYAARPEWFGSKWHGFFKGVDGLPIGEQSIRGDPSALYRWGGSSEFGYAARTANDPSTYDDYRGVKFNFPFCWDCYNGTLVHSEKEKK